MLEGPWAQMALAHNESIYHFSFSQKMTCKWQFQAKHYTLALQKKSVVMITKFEYERK